MQKCILFIFMIIINVKNTIILAQSVSASISVDLNMELGKIKLF
jgi:hypothetical protein